jgi:hypothetical protein
LNLIPVFVIRRRGCNTVFIPGLIQFLYLVIQFLYLVIQVGRSCRIIQSLYLD